MSEKRDETESETIYKDVSLIPKQLSKSQYKRAVVNCRQAKWEGSPGEFSGLEIHLYFFLLMSVNYFILNI